MDSVNATSSQSFVNDGVSSNKDVHTASLQVSKASEKDINFSKSKDLIKDVTNSTPDNRSDVIERAKKLVADPNWLNDSNLSNLSSRLLVVEDF
ncbi:MAG: hypothetical protein VX609_01680 [Verrucomicrobiota bacterium]|nr:hypothetical protein [Verrucomicrobiota bacterium]